MNGNMNGETSSSFMNLSANVSASRTTNDWKISFGSNYNRNRQRYQLSDGEFIGIRKNWSANGLAVKSLNGRWSAGARVTAGSQSTQNQDLSVTVSSGLEFDAFPYSSPRAACSRCSTCSRRRITTGRRSRSSTRCPRRTPDTPSSARCRRTNPGGTRG
jgi:hypothetical protein